MSGPTRPGPREAALVIGLVALCAAWWALRPPMAEEPTVARPLPPRAPPAAENGPEGGASARPAASATAAPPSGSAAAGPPPGGGPADLAAPDNQAPVVNPGGPYRGGEHRDGRDGRPGPPPGFSAATRMRFSGSATDPEGDDLRFRWDFGDGGGADGARAEHWYGAPGPWLAALSVTDEHGAVTRAEVHVEVEDRPPKAIAAPCGGRVGEPVQLDASPSVDDWGAVVAFRWRFADGAQVSTRKPSYTHRFTTAGSHRVELLVEDGEGQQDRTSLSCRIRD